MDLYDIAKNLQKIISTAEEKATQSCGSWKHRYEWLKSDLRKIRDDAEYLRDDMTKHRLTANSIEAEGYLRCALQVCEIIDNIDESYNKQEEE